MTENQLIDTKLDNAWLELEYIAKSSGNIMPSLKLTFIDSDENKYYHDFYFTDRSLGVCMSKFTECFANPDLEALVTRLAHDTKDYAKLFSMLFKHCKGEHFKLSTYEHEYNGKTFTKVGIFSLDSKVVFNYADIENKFNEWKNPSESTQPEIASFDETEQVPF